MNTQEAPQVALLIDGDNVSPDYLPKVLQLAQMYGKVAIKRVYADFTLPQHTVWRNLIFDYGLKGMLAFNFSKGKNTTDIALVIDAMDLLCARKTEVFCIASSDSDFAQLALRLRENGVMVIGMGRFSTLPVFKNACTQFHYLDDEGNKPNLADAVKEIDLEKVQQQMAALPETEEKQATPKTKTTFSGLKVIGKVNLATLNTRNDKKKEEAPKAAIIPKPDASTVNRPFTPEFISRFTQVFNKIANPNTQTVLMSRLGEYLKQELNFDWKKQGFSTLRQFCERLAPQYIIERAKDGCTLMLKREG